MPHKNRQDRNRRRRERCRERRQCETEEEREARRETRNRRGQENRQLETEEEREARRETRNRRVTMSQMLPYGELITLDEPPAGINVLLVEQKLTNAWKKFSLDEHHLVIPIAPMSCKKHEVPVSGGSNYLLSRVTVSPHFPLELGFVTTIHKAQGRTLSHVIIALSRRSNRDDKTYILDMSYESVYVAMTRVEKASNIRLLLHGNNNNSRINSMLYLTELAPNPNVKAFFAGYVRNDDGVLVWDAERAVAMYDHLKQACWTTN
jgi:hypothetical protein